MKFIYFLLKIKKQKWNVTFYSSKCVIYKISIKFRNPKKRTFKNLFYSILSQSEQKEMKMQFKLHFPLKIFRFHRFSSGSFPLSNARIFPSSHFFHHISGFLRWWVGKILIFFGFSYHVLVIVPVFYGKIYKMKKNHIYENLSSFFTGIFQQSTSSMKRNDSWSGNPLTGKDFLLIILEVILWIVGFRLHLLLQNPLWFFGFSI